ncbi:uncharacterized protein CLUP02_15482 [Colletotrichum lupini]|uniref:Uncharacterized protein n=1 Tax=Colletotrichum lupini TaxID=145971 RepID=A0A9Q8T8E0_9PEZI|nr:uncharacterized protein CLUP02_15482 [Colletotrichum lupini]UQC89951.1 hypothetical protein CLUP02_15482 [Colletotrichum lupini]
MALGVRYRAGLAQFNQRSIELSKPPGNLKPKLSRKRAERDMLASETYSKGGGTGKAKLLKASKEVEEEERMLPILVSSIGTVASPRVKKWGRMGGSNPGFARMSMGGNLGRPLGSEPNFGFDITILDSGWLLTTSSSSSSSSPTKFLRARAVSVNQGMMSASYGGTASRTHGKLGERMAMRASYDRSGVPDKLIRQHRLGQCATGPSGHVQPRTVLVSLQARAAGFEKAVRNLSRLASSSSDETVHFSSALALMEAQRAQQQGLTAIYLPTHFIPRVSWVRCARTLFLTIDSHRLRTPPVNDFYGSFELPVLLTRARPIRSSVGTFDEQGFPQFIV